MGLGSSVLGRVLFSMSAHAPNQLMRI
uniref:Uncharacterized protein n=1 Tax=Rhizophora mucronata TaxID=61149 RepID=A0A2P2MXH7_RHIMU